MASGLSIGLSIGLGGIAAVVLGAIADSIDLRYGDATLRQPLRSPGSSSRCCCRPTRARAATRAGGRVR